jgi:tetratricopeptide (TPR) repeat protein
VPPQASLLSNADRERIAEIAATIAATHQNGCIYFGICNNRMKIAAIEESLDGQFAAKGITISRVVLAERLESDTGPQYRAHISDPVANLIDRPERSHTLFFIHGLPELIRAQTDGDSSKVAPVSQLLNYRRELFHDRALCAFFWLDLETVPYLRRNARDFWAFRSGTAYFLETEAPTDRVSGALRQEKEPTPRWSGDLEEKLTQLAAYRRKSPPDDNAIGNLLLDIGRLYAERHELERALEKLHEALTIFESLALEDKVRDAKVWLAGTFKRAGRLDRAETILQQAIRIDERLGNEPSLAVEYNNLSQIYKARGQMEEAEKWLHKAIEIGESLGNEPSLAIHYSNMSGIYYARGQLEEAEKWLRKAIEIDERLVNVPGLAIDYNNLSQIYKARGQMEEAEKWLRKAIEIDERLGDEPHLAMAYNNLSQICHTRSQLDEAEQWLRKATEIDERLGNEPSLAVEYNNLSQIYKTRGQLDEAEKWLRKAISLVEPKGPSAILEDLRGNLDTLLKERQDQTVAKS